MRVSFRDEDRVAARERRGLYLHDIASRQDPVAKIEALPDDLVALRELAQDDPAPEEVIAVNRKIVGACSP